MDLMVRVINVDCSIFGYSRLFLYFYLFFDRICVTTANYPDVMMTAYNNDSITWIYFVSFMIISFFFLMNGTQIEII